MDEILPDRPEVGIALDEWGLWTHIQGDGHLGQGLQHNYNLSDGLVVAATLNELQRIGSRLRMANWSMLVNCLGMIHANEQQTFATPVYHVFRLYRTLCGDQVVRSAVECQEVDIPGPAQTESPVHGHRMLHTPECLSLLEVSATAAPEEERWTLAVVNRAFDTEVCAHLHLLGLPAEPRVHVHTLNGAAVFTQNTFDDPQAVSVTTERLGKIPADYAFPAHSLTLLEVKR